MQTRRGWTLVLASLAVFMTALDTLVVTTALPALRADLGARARLHRRLGRRRAVHGRDLADRRAGAAGHRRGDRHAAHAAPRQRRVPRREVRRRDRPVGRHHGPRRGGRARRGRRRRRRPGLALAGYAWVASIASDPAGYWELGAAFTVAGAGTSFCFPTVANAVMASVPVEAAGVASGASSALRELGGVFGVAVLAAVFAAGGGYGTPAAFVDGFTAALWVAWPVGAREWWRRC